MTPFLSPLELSALLSRNPTAPVIEELDCCLECGRRNEAREGEVVNVEKGSKAPLAGECGLLTVATKSQLVSESP